PRWIEFGHRMRRIRSPVTARLRYLNKSCAQCERKLAGEVSDGQHLVAERWHQQQVHVFENARHLFCHFTPQAVALHKINRREKSRLTENVGPCVRHLHFELVYLMAQTELFKRSRSFGK